MAHFLEIGLAMVVLSDQVQRHGQEICADVLDSTFGGLLVGVDDFEADVPGGLLARRDGTNLVVQPARAAAPIATIEPVELRDYLSRKLLGARPEHFEAVRLALSLLERVPVNLAVSLHATTNADRGRLVPLNERYPLEVLLDTLRS